MKKYRNIVIAAIAAISALSLTGCANNERNDDYSHMAPMFYNPAASSEQSAASSSTSSVAAPPRVVRFCVFFQSACFFGGFRNVFFQDPRVF